LDGVERCIDDEIPFDVPDNWCWVRLNTYLDVRDGTHDTPKYVAVGVALFCTLFARVVCLENHSF